MYTKVSNRALMGFGDTYNDDTPCGNIPAGDPYRKPGNYCATADGGMTTFKADGSVYTATDFPSPTSKSWWDDVTSIFSTATATTPVTGAAAVPVVAHGMSTGTKVALAGGAVILALLIAKM